jgi:hypothetical protein
MSGEVPPDMGHPPAHLYLGLRLRRQAHKRLSGRGPGG